MGGPVTGTEGLGGREKDTTEEVEELKADSGMIAWDIPPHNHNTSRRQSLKITWGDPSAHPPPPPYRLALKPDSFPKWLCFRQSAHLAIFGQFFWSVQ